MGTNTKPEQSREASPASVSQYTVTADSRLSQDIIMTKDILMPATSYNPVAAVPLTSGMSALVVVDSVGLNHVVQDPTQTAGWTLTVLQSTDTPVEVVAALDNSGVAHAFYQDETNTYHSSLGSDGTWTKPDTFAVSSGLGVSITPLGQNVIAYGITGDGNLQIIQLDSTASAWTSYSGAMPVPLNSAQILLQMTSETSFALAASAAGALQTYTGSLNSTTGTYTIVGPTTVQLPIIPPNTSPNDVARIHFAYQYQNSTMWMLSDNQNNLYTSVNFSDAPTLIPSSVVVQGAGVIIHGTAPLISFYGVDTAGTLSVLHQRSWDASGAPVWAPILPLDVNVTYACAPANAQFSSSLFAMGLDNTLHALAQDANSQVWTRNQVQSSGAATGYNMPRFRTQLTITDANGNPAPNVSVDIQADVATAIMVAGATQFIGPGQQAATCTSNVTGVITLSTAAASLSGPTYTVTGSSLTGPLTHQSDGYIQSFLNGTASVNTTSAVIPPMSATTLQNATVPVTLTGGTMQSNPNPPLLAPLLVNDSNGTLATAASKMIIKSVNVGAAAANTAASPAQSGVGWSLDLTDPKNPRFIEFATQEEFDADLQMFTSLGILGDIEDWAGDIWNAIKTGAIAIAKWTVHAVDKTVHLATKIEGVLTSIGKLVIDGIDDAICIVHSILNAIGAELLKVLLWVMDLFGWGDIWNTQQVLRHMVLQVGPAMQYMITQKAVVETGKYFLDLKTTVDDAFQSAISQVGTQTLASLATNGAITGGSGKTFTGGYTEAAALATLGVKAFSAAQNNWLLSKVLEGIEDTLDEVDPLSAIQLNNVSTSLLDDFQSQLAATTFVNGLTTAVTNLQTFLQNIWSNPVTFATTSLADVLNAVQALVDYIIQQLDGLVTTVLEIGAAMFGAMQDLLKQQLGTIPLVTWLYANIFNGGDDPAIIDIVCLVIAAPVTLLFKLANSLSAPFTSDQVTQILAWNFVAPDNSTAVGQERDATSGFPLPANVQKWLVAALSFPQGFLDFSYDASASLDLAADPTGKTPASPWTRWLSFGGSIMTLIMQAASWPGGLFQTDWSGFSLSERLSAASWCIGFVPPPLDFFLLINPNTKTCTRASDWGSTALMVVGGASLGFGMTGSLNGLADQTANGCGFAASVLSPLQNLTQCLRVSGVVSESGGDSLILKGIIDPLSDIGSGLLLLGAS